MIGGGGAWFADESSMNHRPSITALPGQMCVMNLVTT